MTLKGLRSEIDSLDSEIVKLLNKRAAIAQKIGEIKKQNNESVCSPEREKEVYDNIKSHNTGPLTDPYLEAIYREVLAGSRALEEKLKISYLGPEGTFSYLAAKQRFGSSVEYHPSKSIDAVFRDVLSGRAEFGIVPVENSTEGGIRETLNMLVECDVKICAEIVLPIRHNLLANCPDEQINKIYSKLQVFAQCKQWLANNFANAELLNVGSTTEAARIAKQESDAAAIAHTEVAQLYGLNILYKNIEDNPSNITRFFVLSDKSCDRSGRDKTAIMCYIRNEPGALYEILVPFKEHGVNLTNIEPLPTRRGAWDYCFYLDFEGHADEDNVSKALEEVRHNCEKVKVLGSYPKND
jgi:chorismate mutase/prephenate dehydratase